MVPICSCHGAGVASGHSTDARRGTACRVRCSTGAEYGDGVRVGVQLLHWCSTGAEYGDGVRVGVQLLHWCLTGAEYGDGVRVGVQLLHWCLTGVLFIIAGGRSHYRIGHVYRQP